MKKIENTIVIKFRHIVRTRFKFYTRHCKSCGNYYPTTSRSGSNRCELCRVDFKSSSICRRCFKFLDINDKRYNDYTVFGHIVKEELLDKRPICLTCAKNNPDKYHLAYKKRYMIS